MAQNRFQIHGRLPPSPPGRQPPETRATSAPPVFILEVTLILFFKVSNRKVGAT